MQLITQRNQIIARPKMTIRLCEISNPIPRIIRTIPRHALNPRIHRTNPNGIKAHSLDVIQFILDPLPCSAAVVAVRDVARGGSGAVCTGETVDHDLVDCSGTPLVFVCAGNEGEEQGEEKE